MKIVKLKRPLKAGNVDYKFTDTGDLKIDGELNPVKWAAPKKKINQRI